MTEPSDRPDAPPVLLVLDAADDMRATAAALDAHDPGRGRVVVHPTPNSTSIEGLAQDFLVALGKPVDRFGTEKVSGARPAWRAVQAWIVGEEVRQVVRGPDGHRRPDHPRHAHRQ
jgi:hypothetical protein